MNNGFKDKVALITGAASGVGKATALLLAKEQAAVVLVGRRRAALEQVEREIVAHGGMAFIAAADVSDEDQIKAAIDSGATHFGRLDFLVNAAGIIKLGTAENTSGADWDGMFSVNVKGCFLSIQAAMPYLKRRGGAIVNVSSVFAYAAGKGSAGYAASKAAVVALTRTMALDHIDDGVRINGVAPGSMDTPMLTAIADGVAPDEPGKVLTAIGRLHPIRRLIRAEEVAQAIAFLLSDDASAFVGSTLVIDGGRLAKLGSAD